MIISIILPSPKCLGDIIQSRPTFLKRTYAALYGMLHGFILKND